MDILGRTPLVTKLAAGGGLTNCDSSTLLNNIQIIGVYFSAHWCPPCRQFTPQLGSVYLAAKAQRKSFEVIFVSSDQSQEQFRDYFVSMPSWLAVPFEAVAVRNELKTRFSVRGIPCLVLLQASTRQVLSLEGRQEVLSPQFLSTLPSAVDADMVGVTLERLVETLECQSAKEKSNAFNTLGLILSNLLSNPGDPKYCTIKKTNKTISEKLPQADYFKILKLAGFVDVPPDQLLFPETASTAKAKEICDVLHSLVTSLQASSG
eukprot:GHVS01086200.1.p1 GENE.GHVS01086200.1~~GHVS01086200.1.p1  ORF type:complete len:263 (+),score=33.95 GHVS01086200.1:118-906(+)